MLQFSCCPQVFKRGSIIFLYFFLIFNCSASPRPQIEPTSHQYFIDCSAPSAGDGSSAHPWNSLAAAQEHLFAAGDRIALARGTVCHGSFAPRGSGSAGKIIRLTAYGEGQRPQIIASASDRQALLLFNQEHWQIDSLNISGGNTYGVFITGDKGPLEHLYLKNLYIHDVYGGALKNKDNGLVIIGPSSPTAVFNDVLVDGVDVAHTNQWSGIMIGGGNFSFSPDAPLNRHITVRNSTAHDVYGDGIILFRDTNGLIKNSVAWQTGMQPTQDVGTPNAIWTWTCIDCIVEDNEAFLTDSPGVDGGAYDIDWDNHRNIVQRNYAHDTQGYCIAIFAAGYVTTDSVVRDNLCVENALSPRLAALQGAIYLHTWNDGIIRGLRMEGNTVYWNPRVPNAAAIVNDAATDGSPVLFSGNKVISTTPLIYRVSSKWTSSKNQYLLSGEPQFSLSERREFSLAQLQSVGMESGSKHISESTPESSKHLLRIDATINLVLDADDLLSSESRAQLIVLRSLAGQYGSDRLQVTLHIQSESAHRIVARTIQDISELCPGVIQIDHDSVDQTSETIRLSSSDGELLQAWHGLQNAATLGGAVRARLGASDYRNMQGVVVGGK